MNRSQELDLLRTLHKKIENAERSLKLGKTNRDYLAIIYDAKKQIQMINTKLADDKITLRINKVEEDTVSFIVDKNLANEEIGHAKIKMVKNVGILEYSLTQKATKQNYDLRMIKLLCQFMKRQGLTEVRTMTYKEEVEKSNCLCLAGAKTDPTKIRPYNVYSLKIK